MPFAVPASAGSRQLFGTQDRLKAELQAEINTVRAGYVRTLIARDSTAPTGGIDTLRSLFLAQPSLSEEILSSGVRRSGSIGTSADCNCTWVSQVNW